MASFDDTQLIAQLRIDEGVRYSPYQDTRGYLTVGVGHLITGPMPDDWTFPLTDDQVNTLLAGDLQNVFDGLNANLPWWTTLNDARQCVICNMAFNLGLNKLLGFKNTLAAMRQGRYADAAAGMTNSAWASQVGARATRLATIMKNGV
jgi:lysozyme